MSVIFMDQLFEKRPLPRMIGAFCFKDGRGKLSKETQETQFFEIAWTQRAKTKDGELYRYDNLDSPEKEHIP